MIRLIISDRTRCCCRCWLLLYRGIEHKRRKREGEIEEKEEEDERREKRRDSGHRKCKATTIPSTRIFRLLVFYHFVCSLRRSVYARLLQFARRFVQRRSFLRIGAAVANGNIIRRHRCTARYLKSTTFGCSGVFCRRAEKLKKKQKNEKTKKSWKRVWKRTRKGGVK